MTGEECIGSGFYSNGAILFYASSLMLLEIKKWEHRFGTRTAPDRCQGAVSESVHAFEQTRKIQSRIVSFYAFAGFEEARLLADSFCDCDDGIPTYPTVCLGRKQPVRSPMQNTHPQRTCIRLCHRFVDRDHVPYFPIFHSSFCFCDTSTRPPVSKHASMHAFRSSEKVTPPHRETKSLTRPQRIQMLQDLQVGIIPAVDAIGHARLLLAGQLALRYRACNAFFEADLG